MSFPVDLNEREQGEVVGVLANNSRWAFQIFTAINHVYHFLSIIAPIPADFKFRPLFQPDRFTCLCRQLLLDTILPPC